MSDESKVTFDTILTECGVSIVDLAVNEDFAARSEAWMKVHTYVKQLHEAATAKPTATDTEKVIPAYRQGWMDDEQAKLDAESLCRKFVDQVAPLEDNAAFMWQLREAVKGIIGQYLTNEVEFAEWKAGKSMPQSIARSPRQVNREKYRTGVKGLNGLFLAIGHTLTLPTGALRPEKGALVPNFEAIRGGGNGAGIVTGKNAKLYRLRFTIGNEVCDSPREAVRIIWTGAERVGKTTSTLLDIIEKDEAGRNAWTEDKPVTLTINGKSVTIVNVNESSEEDDEEDDDE